MPKFNSIAPLEAGAAEDAYLTGGALVNFALLKAGAAEDAYLTCGALVNIAQLEAGAAEDVSVAAAWHRRNPRYLHADRTLHCVLNAKYK